MKKAGLAGTLELECVFGIGQVVPWHKKAELTPSTILGEAFAKASMAFTICECMHTGLAPCI